MRIEIILSYGFTGLDKQIEFQKLTGVDIKGALDHHRLIEGLKHEISYCREQYGNLVMDSQRILRK